MAGLKLAFATSIPLLPIPRHCVTFTKCTSDTGERTRNFELWSVDKDICAVTFLSKRPHDTNVRTFDGGSSSESTLNSALSNLKH
ncbi:hypothetical protein AVEN_16704-1 [Araneus ventricosus]|uniref:Uncharacterized protein n=1 Tax=Araneus ventricosus TaxID=182803 RepID=A0A4Y2W757_ARAVE|nr:hypothetical protein AVEN_16704-1 [Araneus ventricosus]